MGVGAAIAAAAVVGAVATTASSNKAANAQKDAAKTASGQLNSSTGAAKEDLFKLFPAAQQNSQQGYQGALDVFNQSVPQQIEFGQSGNIAAQNQLLSGMSQYQNAILGNPVDYSQFQATDLGSPNLDFLNQQLSYTDPYASADPWAGMTNDQIQYATANQPVTPTSLPAGLINQVINKVTAGRQANNNYLTGLNQPAQETYPNPIDIGVPSFKRFSRFGR